MFMIYFEKYHGVAAGVGGIETYTNGVWCDVFSVANCNGKNM